MSLSSQCALCSNDATHYPIHEGEKSFCCPGCQAVYNILSAINQLNNYQDTSIFKQAVNSGLIANPFLLEQIQKNKSSTASEEIQKIYLEINEMWCPACAEIIKLILLQKKGIQMCVVDYSTDIAAIEYNPRAISKDEIFKSINALGYKAEYLENSSKVSFNLYLRFAIAAFCSLNIMMFSYPIYATYFDIENQGLGPFFAWISLFTSLPVMTYCAWPIFKRFISGLKAGLFGMETLVVIGVSAAFWLSIYNLWMGNAKVYFDSMTAIITLVILGKIIESKAKFSAKETVVRLLRSLPKKGRKKQAGGTLEFVPIKEITLGDTLATYTGEKIALDGMVTEGSGICDESILTGESYPVAKSIGSKVLAGSILLNGTLEYKVTSKENDTIFYRIINLVQEGVEHKIPYVRYADVIVRWFVPLILLIAIATGFFYWMITSAEIALITTISILLISCPCAIGIAAPLAEAYLISGMARSGAIIRNRGCLPFFGNEDILVFDKTGTITKGVFMVLAGLENLPEEQLSILKGLSSKSTHPIARAIFMSIDGPSAEVKEVAEYAGLGMRGTFKGFEALLGSAAFLKGKNIPIEHNTSINVPGINSKVYFCLGNQCITSILLGDAIRPEAKEIVQQASARTVLLSGDHREVVESVAQACGFDEWKGECTPLEKKEFISQFRRQGKTICMIGDGINDAPALTEAHIGISVVSASDISIQVSDILLTNDGIKSIPHIRRLAKFGHRIIKQNLFWAFIYNIVGIALASFGMLSPIFAAFAMTASSLIVIFNAHRLKQDAYDI